MLEQLTPSQLATLLNSAPIGMLLLDGDGKVSWMNDSLSEILGQRGQELIGKTATTANSDLRINYF